MVDKQRGVWKAARKPKVKKEQTELIKPSTRSLFQTIYCLLDLVNVIWFRWIFKTQRLLHVDCLFQITMEKGILNIQLLNFPLLSDCNVENCAYGSSPYNRAESLYKISPFLLLISSCNKPGLELIHSSIGIVLHLVNPSTTQRLLIFMWRH